ncbi:rod shape-determining protein MreB [Lachnospiraceae bacterium XBB2008]|nr:rod shape-determining protein MreB [Lachnospiraceae bacterium XBB2008]
MNSFGIDLGTSNIKIYDGNDGNTLIEKNIIAVNDKGDLFAYGDSAYEMYEKAPANIHISYPLCNGVIAELKYEQTLVRNFLTDLMKGNVHPADYYVTIPWDVTEVEKRAFYDLVKEANVKAKKIMIVEKAVADGIGMGIDVLNAQGVLVVNVGFDTTEISILSLGGIVLSKLIKVGGLKFDESIRNAIRTEYSLIIGGKTASYVKNNLLELEEAGEPAVVYGRDIVTGLPVERSIPTDLVDSCMKENFTTIIDNIRVILERTPPELAADIYKHGIYLTGGASQTAKLVQQISAGTGLKVNISDSPITSVVDGLAKIIEDEHYRTVAYAPR